MNRSTRMQPRSTLRTCLLMLLVAVALPHTAALGEVRPFNQFSRGNQLFAEGLALWDSDSERALVLIADARAAYDGVTMGQRTSAVYANAGNAAFLLDDLPGAILAYRRALLADPRDPVATAGLAAARNAVAGPVPASTGTRITTALVAWRSFVSGHTLALIALAAWATAWLVLLARWTGRRVPLRIWPIALTCGISAAGATFEHALIHRPDHGVLTQSTTGFAGPSASVYEASFSAELPPGTEFVRTETRGDWWRVRLADGGETWIIARQGALIRND